ncbi:hypothetical protein FB567DRAFT_545087 [Paraphoma chrysanthemicola]|uniref:SRR1-like domain-containing protein n=1 Tax=Paraphoma chrysanthemicola TaxID=798071 RepID=A0A8K0W3F4_9PLEO|nr:hypothetical protein FB567DRAFT_545087 [Paraphoma chrysanthemicola]
MSLAVLGSEIPFKHPLANGRVKGKSLPRELRQLANALELQRVAYEQSQFSKEVQRNFQAVSKHSDFPITRILSLGLGSLLGSRDQTRRIKQLAILLAIHEHCSRLSGTAIELYAQDPAFTRGDEAFLINLGFKILRTPSGTQLGQAGDILSSSTLIYSPFLTIEVYEQLTRLNASLSIPIIVGDDFMALAKKWPKHSAEHKQVNDVMKLGLSKLRRRALAGDGFWMQEDETFPMAMYESLSSRGTRIRARI